MKRHKMHLGVLAIAALASLLFVPAASASIVGVLDVANCNGGGVTVAAGTIIWAPPIGSPPLGGCLSTGISTTVTYGTASTLGAGVLGEVLDLAVGGGAIPDFMTFVNGPDTLRFTLLGIGPGVSNTICSTTLNQNAPACSVNAGSPFILTQLATGSVVQLSAFGTVVDPVSGGISNWSGQFSATFTPNPPASDGTTASIQSEVLAGTAITTTYSGKFILTAAPEPVSMALIGGGLIGLALLRKRRRHA